MTTYSAPLQDDKPRHRWLRDQIEAHVNREGHHKISKSMRVLAYDGVAANQALHEVGLSFPTDDRDEEFSEARDEFIREAIREKAERESNTPDAESDDAGVVSH